MTIQPDDRTAPAAASGPLTSVEALIEGIRGDRPKLVGESADMLYHLLTLWASLGVKPKTVWAELARREGLSGIAEKAARKSK